MALTARTASGQQVGSTQGEAPKVEQAAADATRARSSRVSFTLERGSKVTVGNRTTGRITIVGWDQDTIEATATSERGEERVRVSTDEGPSGKSVFLKADYANRIISLLPEILIQSTPSPTPEHGIPPSPPPPRMPALPFIVSLRPRQVHLEVKLPRDAEVQLIEVNRSDVEVTGMDTPITISGGRSRIVLKRVRAVEVRTRSGDVEVEAASGLVDVVTTSGAIKVRNAGSDVRALSINGSIEIQCARGRVDVGNTDGSIDLVGVAGDVDANATNSSVHFTGAVRENGRYYLKSMSGQIEMTLRANVPGFTAYLSSYRGAITNEFSMKATPSSQENTVNRRLVGRYGNGRAQITLDSFDGAVKLSKMSAGRMNDCRY